MPKIATDTIISLQFEMEPCDWNIHDAFCFLNFLICVLWYLWWQLRVNSMQMMSEMNYVHVVKREKIFANWKWSTKCR